MADTPISVTTFEPTQGISVVSDGTQPPGNPVDEAVAKQRAAKASWAMGEEARPQDNTYNKITSGYEGMLRNQDATAKQVEDRQRRLGVIQEMVKGGQPLNEAEVQTILTLSQDKLRNPNTVWEEEFAKRTVDTALTLRPYKPMDDALAEAPDETMDAMDVAQEMITKKEIAQRHLEDMEQKWKGMSIGGKVLDFGLTMVPFYSWYNLQNELEQAQPSALLPGSNLLEQVEYLHTLPPAEFDFALSQVLGDLSSRNVTDAITFAQAAMQMPSTDVALTNAFGILDVADVALTLGIGAAARKGARRVAELAKPTNQVKGALKSIVKATGEPDATVGKVVAATGDIESGAILEASRRYVDKLATGGIPNVQEVRRTLPSIFNPGSMVDNAKGKTNDLLEHMRQNASNLARAIVDGTGVERLPQEALAKAAREAVDALKGRYAKTVNSSILDIGEQIDFNPQSNTYSASISIGTPEKTLFETPAKANRFAADVYKLPENSYTLEQQGTGYYIKLTKDIDETTDNVRDQLVQPTTATKDTLDNMLLGLLRTPEEQLGQNVRAARHVATYGPSELQRAVRPLLDDIQSLGSKAKDRLTRVLEANRDHIELDANGNVVKRGRYFNSTSDFETHYKDITGVAPTEADTKAYFNYRQLSDFDYMIRNMGIYRDYVRQGAESAKFAFTVKNADGSSKVVNTPSFVSKPVDGIPFDNPEDAGIFVYNSDTNSGGFRLKNNASADLKEYINDLVTNKGYKVLQVFNPNDMPMRQVFGVEDVVNFIVVRDVELTRLNWNPLPYNEGPHVAYNATHFVKQPKVRRTQDAPEMQDVTPETPPENGHTRLWTLSNGEGEVSMYHAGPGAEKMLREAQKTTGGELKFIDLPNSEVRKYKEPEAGKPTSKSRDRRFEGQEKVKTDRKNFLGTGYRIPQDVAAGANRKVVARQGAVRHIYEGDKSVFGMSTEAEATKYANAMEKARKMLLADDPELDDFITNNLPFTPSEFRIKFEDVVGPDGVVKKADFDKNAPFVRVAASQGTNDVAVEGSKKLRDLYEGFEDTVDSSYNLFRNINKKYAGERNEPLWRPEEMGGSDDKPLINLGTAPMVDPMATINDSLSNVIRSRYFDDLKISNVEQFVQEFRDVLKNPPEQMKNDPVAVLHKPMWDDATASNRAKLAAARNFRRATLNLIGTDSEVGKYMKYTTEKLISSIYGKMNVESIDGVPSAFRKGTTSQNFADYTAYHLLPKTQDPTRYMRAMAFHLKLGLFNPVQIFVQGQTFAHIFALAPRHAMQSMGAAGLMRMMSLTDEPNVIRSYAKQAKLTGWAEEEFIESFTELKKTGMYNVEGEHSWKDDMVNMNLMQTKAGKFLDAGTVFFKETERAIRITAWNTAYREWKSKNPTRTMDNRTRALVIARANDLTVNMTRASNAAWNQGLLSIPTQFFSYQFRLMDQLLGRRLTMAEKVRVGLVYSAMYGVPVAGGAYLGVVPLAEMINKEALNRGIDFNSNVLSEMVMKGIPSTMLRHLTGEEYNVGERYGPGGLTILKDIARGDSGVADLVFGASGSILGDVLASSDPVLRGLMGLFKDGNDEYPLMMQDFIAATQNISSVNNAARIYYAMNVGKWYTRNGLYLDDITGPQAAFMALTGLSPAEVSETFLSLEQMKDDDNAKRKAMREASKYIKFALEAQSEEDKDKYMAAAKSYLIMSGAMPNEYSRVTKEALNPESLVDSVQREFWDKAPLDKKEQRMQMYLNRKLEKANQ